MLPEGLRSRISPLPNPLPRAGEGRVRGIRLAEHKIHAPIFISLFTDKF